MDQHKVWKYELIEGRSTIAVPEGATVLTAQLQGQMVSLWMRVPNDADLRNHVERQFIIVPTGFQTFPEAAVYIATVQRGSHVCHVFEVPYGAF